MNEFEPTRSVTVTDPTEPDIPLVDLEDITPDESLVADVRKTRITTPLTRVLLAFVVVAAAMLGGAVLDRWQRPASASAAAGRTGFPAGFPGIGGGAGGASGASGASGTAGAGGAAGATFGTVKLVDGTSVYVTDAQGNTVKVTTLPTTTVSVTKTGKASDLKPGSTVIVQGKQSADGTSVAATSISQSAGFGGGGGLGTAGGTGTAAGG